MTRGSRSRRSTRSRSRRTHRATVRANNHPHMVYKSTHTTFTSHPAKGDPFGIRTTVSLKNGKGTKKIQTLDPRGKTLKSKTKSIYDEHVNQIREGKYVPGLWGV